MVRRAQGVSPVGRGAVMLYLCVAAPGCLWVVAAPMIASQQQDGSTSIEACKGAAIPVKVAGGPEVYRCNSYDVVMKGECGQAEGPAEIVWGPHRSPVSVFFKNTRKSCPIHTHKPVGTYKTVRAEKENEGVPSVHL